MTINHPFAHRAKALLPLVAAFLLLASSARAQQAGVGLRAGVSADPNQFYFGAHYDTGPLFEKLSFRPNVEIGVGDDVTSVSGNIEFVYWVPIPDQPFTLYAGGGPAINLYKFDDSLGGGTKTQPGFNILVGIAHKGGLFAEVKLGFIDSPDFKFGVGYTWR